MVWSKVKKGYDLFFLREFRLNRDMIEFKIDDVPLKKIVNFLKIRLNKKLKTSVVFGYPYNIQINPYFGCNLKCPKCPSQKTGKIKRGALPFDVFKKYFDEVGEYALFLTLWSWGEPFLNRKLPEIIKYAKSKKMIVRTSTNGNLLDDEEFNRRIIMSGLDELIIALDGISEETYLKYRKGGNHHKVVEGVRNIVKLKKQLKSETPLINLRMVVTSHTEDEIPIMKKLAEELEVDLFALKTVNPNCDKQIADINLIPKNKDYWRYAYYPGTFQKIEPKEFYCHFLWDSSVLFTDGTVVSCEWDDDVDFPYGNIKEQSFREIWFGNKANQFRKQVLKDHNAFEFCQKCPYKGMIRDCVAEVNTIKN